MDSIFTHLYKMFDETLHSSLESDESFECVAQECAPVSLVPVEVSGLVSD